MISGPPSEQIKSIFSSVASGYDKANDWMTFGLARRWRRELVRWSGAKTNDRVLDCATGTGDLAFEFKRVVGANGHVIGIDFCPEMLELAGPKGRLYGLDVEFKAADVLNLPFADNTFAVCSIAYGIRNVADPVRALQEMARVVQPGGTVMILETGDSPESAIKPFMNFYIQQIVPRVGGWITGHRGAYEYLNKSSRAFPSRERFIDMMKESLAFSRCEFQVLFGGASFIYKGIK